MDRSKWLQIPVSEQEHTQAKRLANQYGISVSDLVRRLVVYAEMVRPQLSITASQNGKVENPQR